MSDTISADWIAVDWGTSNLRAWAMTSAITSEMIAANYEYASVHSTDGMGRLAHNQFETALLKLINPWIPSDKSGVGKITVIACGMVGSRQGWIEAPYIKSPCPALSDALIEAPVAHPLLRVYIVPGICQNAPADVMRGEETQIAGFVRGNPDWDGVICLPGSHTKWVRVKAGRVVHFQTFMSGELFSTLGSQTVLRHTIAPIGWDDASFLSALGDMFNQPQYIAARLFSLRAEDLLYGLDGGCARARLSGMLIGMELAAARPYWSEQAQSIAIIGTGNLAKLYAQALATQGISATIADDRQMTLGGLTAARVNLSSRQ